MANAPLVFVIVLNCNGTQSLFRVKCAHNGLIERNIMAVQTVMQDASSSFLNRTQLIKLKFKAMRAGVWFKALPRIDRVLVDLTIKVAENIRSIQLAKSIFAVVGKLEGLLESSVSKSLRLIGRPLAEKISLIAQKWGNASAKSWATDSSFAFFLAVMHTPK
jgi:hypothetical protein